VNFKKLLTAIRTNGCEKLTDARSTRQVVYTNLIWLCTVCAIVLYTLAVALLVPVPLVHFLLTFLVLSLLILSPFFLIRMHYPEAGKHMFIIAVYLMIGVADHLHRKEGYTWLFYFAFLPAAMNIFPFSTRKITIAVYTLFPLLYTLITKLAVYDHPAFPPLPRNALPLLIAINITISFSLFVVFAGYMILNNLAKQNKLILKSIGLQTTLDNSDAAIWSIDNDFNLMAINSRYAESIEKEFGLTGLKAGINLRKHPLWQRLPDTFKQEYFSVLSGQDILHETTLNDKIFEIKAVPIYDARKQIGGATFGSRDITARKKAEAALIEAKKAAEEAGRAKARFLSNMSHEIRTPLNGIIGLTRIMQDEEVLPSQIGHLKTLQDLSEHTVQLINNILDFAKIEAGKASLDNKRFNLKELIGKIHAIFLATAKLKGIRFNIETEGITDIYLKGDEVRLSQVLINLLSNAFKFTEQGHVTLHTHVQPDAGGKSCTLRFRVADTGIGIRQEKMGVIFESFSQADQRTTRRYGGTGLGLSIADKILSLMNSHIDVQSEVGKGSEFSFEVHLIKSSYEPMPATAKKANSEPSLKNMEILLAEDNKVNQVVANSILKKWNSRVTIASNGKEAFEKVQKNRFDVVLMDLDMPVMDGYESMALIRTHYPGVPVIALTAASFDDMNNFLLNKGFSGVVQKPFIPADLFNKITTVTHPS
jgi:signal transduction histidine kinase/CheY-like chemotaxis protein